jgi:hypothetical protein
MKTAEKLGKTVTKLNSFGGQSSEVLMVIETVLAFD